MTAQIKVKVQRKAIVKFKVLPRFSAQVAAGTSITISLNGAVYTVSIDAATLALINSVTTALPDEPVIVTTAAAAITAGTKAVAVQRVAPVSTTLALPLVTDNGLSPLHIFDWSTSVTDHVITITPAGANKIMRAASWALNSNSVQLSSVTLYPSILLGGWYIAP